MVAWHRAGFRAFWNWKSGRRIGRPSVPPQVQAQIRTTSTANPRFVKNVRHVWDGGCRRRNIYFATVAWLTSMPSFSSRLLTQDQASALLMVVLLLWT